MRKTLLGALACLVPATAFAETYQVGEHVTSQQDGTSGTVIEVGQQLADGGTMIKVHLDTLSPAFPNVGVWWDTAMVKAHAGGAAPPAAPPQAPPPPQAQAPAPPQQPQPVNTNLPPAPNPNTAQPNAALCQQLIRGRYVATGDDSTVTVTFQGFQMAAPAPYSSNYVDSAWTAVVGEPVNASKIQARYTVLTHYNDPHADDQLRTITADYECYQHPTAGWLVEQVDASEGSETSQYIHKG